jgi:peptide deformylase
MSKYDIVLAPDPVLKKLATPLERIDDETRQLMDDMIDTMYDGQGIGLAAPQIALSKRLLVLDVEQDEEKDSGNPQVFANPEILWSSDDPNIYNEGCLSIPGHYAEIERPKIIRVKYLDYDGKQQEIEADGLLATCLQHEIDHLDGVLFIDYLSTLKRNMIIKKMKKSKKNISAL